jgi:hypothetical protein
VAVGVLGCPNIPLAPLTYADTGPSQQSGAASGRLIGTVFVAAKGLLARTKGQSLQ